MKNYNLLIILESKIKLFICSTLSKNQKSILIEGNEYMEIPIGYFNGFYDWLRNASGYIIGVRYFPFEDSSFLLDELGELEYLRTDKNKDSINICFLDETHCLIDEEASNDQDFSENRIFKSSEGKFLFIFDITRIKETLDPSINIIMNPKNQTGS